MFFEHIKAAAFSSGNYPNNQNGVKIIVSSLADNAESAIVFNSLRAVISGNSLEARIFTTGSFGYFDLEPLLLIEKPDQPAILYHNVTPETAAVILRDYLLKSDPRHDLAYCSFGPQKIEGIPDSSEMQLFSLQNRIALRNCGFIDPSDVNDYIWRARGYSGLDRALRMDPGGVFQVLKTSGLREGADEGGSAAEKWRDYRAAAGDQKLVICNALDTDPCAITSRLLLESDPHSVIEGMLIAAYAIGAARCIICADNRHKDAIQRLERALNQIKECGLSGKGILGTSFSVEIQVKEIAASLVLGDETALLSYLEGKPAMPCVRLPFQSPGGLRNQTALVNDTETFSAVSAIFQNSPDRFSATGTKPGHGTKIVTLSGAVVHKYTVEVPLGTSIQNLMKNIGGGALKGEAIKAVRFGGPTGAYFNIESIDIPIEYGGIFEAGTIMGSGTIEVIPYGVCSVEMTGEAMSFIHAQSCGKCVFCREGTYQMAGILAEISQNRGKPEDLDLLIELSQHIKLGSICFLGRTAPNPVLSSLNLFKGDYETHIKEKRCLEA